MSSAEANQPSSRVIRSVTGSRAGFASSSVSRRGFVRFPALLGLGALVPDTEQEPFRWLSAQQAPVLQRSEGARPATPSGVASGDVTDDSAIIWSRTDRPSRMMVEWSTTSGFANAQRVRGPLTLAGADYTARVDLRALPANQDIFYRVTFVDIGDSENISRPLLGHLRTAPGAAQRSVSFAWSGDTNGQGWGINPEWGGMRIFDAIRRLQPDFFIHSGDIIYADGPIRHEVPLAHEITLPDGRTTQVWRNLVIPGVEKVAETLEEYRARYRYNYLDEKWRALNAETPMFAQWDDHEVTNNWWPGQLIPEDRAFSSGYTERRVDVLAANATTAFFDYLPIRRTPEETERVYRKFRYGPDLEVFMIDMRSYRAPNSRNRQPVMGPETTLLGRGQIDWLKASLRHSNATWKVIASDMPLGLFVADALGSEAVANDDPGAPAGRELELAEILSFIKAHNIQNTVWVTADVHYAASHYYEPTRGAFSDFLPFWEFVSGPLHAGTFGPNRTDATFGPQVVWQSIPDNQPANESPAAGKQFFGIGKLNPATRVLTLEHYNLAGEKVWSMDLQPK